MKYLSQLFLFCLIVSLASCGGNGTEPEPDVLGCMDPTALNFNPNATKDDGSCTYEVLGCMDPTALNFNPNATKDDGSCTYEVLGCMDPTALNFNPNATKDDGSCTYGSTNGNITSIPTSFKQKVLIEYFTGNWCGYCTDGQVFLENLAKEYSEQVIISQAHTKDAMMLPEYRAYMKFELGGEFAPGATVNRTPSLESGDVYMSRDEWQGNIEELLKTPTNNIGLAIETSITDDEMTVNTHVGFLADQTKSYKLFILVLEDSVIGSGDEYDQANYYNENAGHPYFGLGNPIVGYPHKRVVRAYAYDVDGEAIPAEEVKANNVYIKSNTFDISEYRKEYVSVVAFVVESRGTPVTSPVVNVQTVKAGATKNWD